MRYTFDQLKLGDVVEAEVVDVVSPNELIVSFHGDLMRVSNKSRQILRIHQQVQLRVVSVQPLSFQLLEANKNRGYQVRV